MMHGTVSINHHQIVKWTAEHTQTLKHDYVMYQCRATGYKVDGRPFNYDFDVYHVPDEGGMKLTRLIFEQIEQRMR